MEVGIAVGLLLLVLIVFKRYCNLDFMSLMMGCFT